jgi:cobalamin biosynthesis Co2+ chelatase CbiK
VQHDILGSGPESWKSELLKMGPYQVDGIRRGLGDRQAIINIYREHLAQAMKGL